MPIVISKDLPAYKTLTEENIFAITKNRAETQDIRPIEIAILNLMPTKIATETQLLRLLSNSPLQTNITLVSTESYVGKNTPKEHLEKFYKPFSQIKDRKFDGLIITGAPVENYDFEQVTYWKELEDIMEFAKTNVTSTIFICWGAQAALHYYYGIEKHPLEEKLFGVFKHTKLVDFDKLLKGVDDEFYMPHSRHTTVYVEDILKKKNLTVLAKSDKAGATIVKSNDNKFIFIFGHTEYDRDTLKKEYERDLQKGLPIKEPENYFVNGYQNGEGKINMCWSSTANLIYSNWLNYYVYQATPYDFIDKK